MLADIFLPFSAGFCMAASGQQSYLCGVPWPCWWPGHRYGGLQELRALPQKTGHEVQAEHEGHDGVKRGRYNQGDSGGSEEREIGRGEYQLVLFG